MAEDRPFEAEWTELEKIDFLLDELARAVERGEVHEASYRLLSPRYLRRRAQLVATINGAPQPPELPGYSVGSAGSAPAAPVERPARAWKPQPSDFSAFAESPVRPVTTPVRAPAKPVAWTTVLLYLGAFLVIVASAVFSIAIWDLLGATGKLVLLSLVTAAFYGAGYFVRARLDVPSGATALTAVASAMLLFDGWIAIRGYHLEGPLPWAVLLLVCSAAYWFTEVRLANRFFGVIGAAAQMGWWWLLGAGLGLPVLTRLAGMALVVVAWQLAAERGRADKAVGSLARVLEWAAPIGAVLLTVGVVADLALVGSTGLRESLGAAVVAGAGALVVVRSRELPARSARLVAALLQAPLFAAIWLANIDAGDAWWMFAAFLAMSLVYGTWAVFRGGRAFSVLAVLSEFSAALMLLDVLDSTTEVSLGVLAGLAVLWALAARIASGVADTPGMLEGLSPLAEVARWSSTVLLAGVSLALPVAMRALPLAGFAIGGAHVAVASIVLVAWAAATVSATREAGLVGTSVFSFYTLGAAMAWRVPESDSAYYAAGLLVLAWGWLAASPVLSRFYSEALMQLLRWADRALLAVIALSGVVLSVYAFGDGRATGAAAISTGVVAAAFAYDAFANRSALAAGAASAFGVGAVALATGTLPDPRGARIATSLAGPGAAALVALGATSARRRPGYRGYAAAVAASVVGSVVALGGWGEPAWLVAALLLAAAAWGIVAWRVEEAFTLPAGLALMGAAAAGSAALDAGTWPTVVLVGTSALALTAVCLLPAFGPLGGHRRAGAMLGVAGLAGVLAVLWVAWFDLYAPADRVWLALGTGEITVLLLVAAASVLVQGHRWDVEAATYVGWGLVLLATWNAWGDSERAIGEWYTTSLAAYLGAMGYLFARRDRSRSYPVTLDAVTVAAGLGFPLLWALTAGPSSALTHFLWVFTLSVAFIVLGIALKVRWHFFGGVGALALVAVYRAFTTLAAFSWLLLGVIGIAMLVIAVTWEQQRSTRERLRASFHGWR